MAALALGPSLLGLLPGDLPHVLFPTEARPVLGAVAQLGLVLFMFLIGLEADTSLVRGQARLALTVSLSSIALPFALGARREPLEVRARGTKQLVEAARRLGLDVRTPDDTRTSHDARTAPALVVRGPDAPAGSPAGHTPTGGLPPLPVTVVPAGPRARHGLAERASRFPVRARLTQRTLIEEPL